ncbi:MAG: N-acetylmuramoyl-L-alanine amidase, partial [Bacteroidaceae bacterium]|nr:N-acetylmuramoyl-L-alanine amidase [Bacteroidaceae bacterium]
MLKRLYIILLLTSAFILSAQARRYTIVIDAGHGGHDTGAQGEYLKEKDINLDVALAFGKYVEENMQDVDVVYTRKTDVFVPLKERANIANKKRADIFISIHTNAVPKGRNVYGIETYTMGLRRSNEKFSAALRENEVITYEEDYQEKYNGYDPKSPESLIMFELIHDSNMEESVSLASSIQKNICSEAGRQSKGVKQDVFLVLRETSMPACLVELGFISTPDEEAFLATKDGLDRLARGIYKGLASYTKKGKTDLPPPTPTRQETQQPSPQQNAQPVPKQNA